MDETTLPSWLQEAVSNNLLPLALAQEVNQRFPDSKTLTPEIKRALAEVLGETKPQRQFLARTGDEAMNEDLARQLMLGYRA